MGCGVQEVLTGVEVVRKPGQRNPLHRRGVNTPRTINGGRQHRQQNHPLRHGNRSAYPTLSDAISVPAISTKSNNHSGDY